MYLINTHLFKCCIPARSWRCICFAMNIIGWVVAEEKAYFKLLRDIYEINVSWPHREEGEIKQASHIWSRTPPPWIGKLSLTVTGSSGRVRARFNFVSCKNSPLWETTDGASHTGLGIWLGPSLKVELRRQQPAENSSAATPRWTLANALVPFMAQGACGFYSAEATSQVSLFIGIIMSTFVDSCFWSYLSCWQHLLSPWMEWDTEHLRAMPGLMAVHVKACPCTCRGQESRGESVLPSQALLLGSTCSQWRDAIEMQCTTVHGLTCPWAHWRLMPTRGVRARSLVISFAFPLLTHSAPADFSFCYGCGYLKLGVT